jgi:4-diphosphocytidyl-2-C-methyl-D-erythritol kinase
MAAGLAGGSADAAAVLRGLNYLYGKPFTREELCKIGMEIGSDVPFCIVGGTQVCKNKGDVTYSMNGIQAYHILIAYAGNKESTADQYRMLDEKYNDFIDYRCGKNYGDLFAAFSVGRCREGFKLMFNIFEDLYENDENIKKIKKIMLENEAKMAMISGSGPAVFGAFPNFLYAQDAKELLAKEGITSYICCPIELEYDEMTPGKPLWH